MYTDEDDELQGLTPAEAFRRAKIDHFLQQVHEDLNMGRYVAALKTLETVFALDQGNGEGQILRRTIDEQLSRMLNRGKNGGSGNTPGDAPSMRPRRSEVVLVVDQDERLLTSLTTTLRRYGFMSAGAASYEEGVETFTLLKPDVVISEVNFESGAKGFDLYFWLRTNGGNRDLPFLFLATRIDRDTLIAGKRFGVDDLILKPVDDDVVIASVINSLSRRKMIPAQH